MKTPQSVPLYSTSWQNTKSIRWNLKGDWSPGAGLPKDLPLFRLIISIWMSHPHLTEMAQIWHPMIPGGPAVQGTSCPVAQKPVWGWRAKFWTKRKTPSWVRASSAQHTACHQAGKVPGEFPPDSQKSIPELIKVPFNSTSWLLEAFLSLISRNTSRGNVVQVPPVCKHHY